jgi:hypothetical protein
VALRIEADLPAKSHLWVDDLRLQEVDQNGKPLSIQKAAGPGGQATATDLTKKHPPRVVNVSQAGKPPSPTPVAPTPSHTHAPAKVSPPVVTKPPVPATKSPRPQKTFEVRENSADRKADWIPRTHKVPALSRRPKSTRRAPR